MPTISNQVTVRVLPSTIPQWFTSLGHLQWGTPVTNWLGANEVKPNPLPVGGTQIHSSIVKDWCGMGMDETRKTIFMLHNGGHNTYYGNEVYSCDLSSASPQWIRRRNPSTPTGTGNLTKFSDGRPCSDHTTSLNIAAEGRWFTPGMSSTNQYGYANYSQWWEYDPVANDYIDLGTNHPGSSASVKGLALFDPVDRQMITLTIGGSTNVAFTNITAMSGAPTISNTNTISVYDGPSGAVDYTNRIVLFRGLLAGSPVYQFLRLTSNATKAAAFTTLSVSGTAPSDSTSAMHWHPPSNAFLSWGSTGGLYKLTPTISNGTYTSATWTHVNGNGGPTPAVEAGTQGMWNKIQLIQDMGNGDSALVVVPRYAFPDVYVMRIIGGV